MKVLTAAIVAGVLACAAARAAGGAGPPPQGKGGSVAPLLFASAKDLPCDGNVKVFPADQLGREYRGYCASGLEIWTWAATLPAPKPAANALFIMAINKRGELASVERDLLYIVSLDAKRPDDARRAKVARALDPEKLVTSMANLGLDQQAVSVGNGAFPGGAISPAEYMAGIVYFGKIDGIRPKLMYPIDLPGKPRDFIEIPINDGR